MDWRKHFNNYQRSIYPAKFGQNLAGSLGVSITVIVEDAQQMTNDHKSSPCAFGSGELKLKELSVDF